MRYHRTFNEAGRIVCDVSRSGHPWCLVCGTEVQPDDETVRYDGVLFHAACASVPTGGRRP